MAYASRYYRFTVPTSGDGIYVKLRLNSVWIRGDRVNRKLILVANPHTRERSYCHDWQAKDHYSEGFLDRDGPHPQEIEGVDTAMSGLESESYARFRGKLYKGSASLGVTFASWQQSADMIRHRYSQLSDLADRRFAWIKLKHRLLQKITAKDIADFHLEVIFGWKPLLQDIHAAATTIIDTRPQTSWVGASASTKVRHASSQPLGGSNTAYRVYDVSIRNFRSAKVELSNPNLWLRERAGLNNPAAVAWDLVPWSFVVNMFVNTGQLVNSLSDFAGLSFSDASMVRAYRLNYDQVLTGDLSGHAAFEVDYKYRTLDGIVPPPLVMKVPGMNMETLSMAASLFTQKFSRVLREMR